MKTSTPKVIFTDHGRVDDMYQELKMTKLSQESLQAEQRKRDHVVEQTSKALDMMEEENKNFQQVESKDVVKPETTLHKLSCVIPTILIDPFSMIPVILQLLSL